ncbi:MAG: glycosyltransferase [Lachnospiraceae bacterium]|nr:glycosyltransferase [Lachnospiraceae bacterium]
MALFSIITTCFNAEGCIEKTIRSVLSQDFRDFEYIIMDGASKDHTLKIAGSFEDAFAKAGIPYRIFCEEDHGIYEGMNHGVSHALGDFVNFLNADDCLTNEHTLSDLASFVNNTAKYHTETEKPVIFYGDAAAVEFGETYRYVKDLSLITKRMPFSHQSVFALRSLLEEYPFRETYRIGADYDFLLHSYRNGYRFADTGLPICIVTLDGLSSVDLLHTFIETTQIQRSYGIDNYPGKTYDKKLHSLKIKQFVIDHFPKWCIRFIRKIQRIKRGQNEHC